MASELKAYTVISVEQCAHCGLKELAVVALCLTSKQAWRIHDDFLAAPRDGVTAYITEAPVGLPGVNLLDRTFAVSRDASALTRPVSASPIEYKIVLVGPAAVGKTSWVYSLHYGRPPTDPSILLPRGKYTVRRRTNRGDRICFRIWDGTAGYGYDHADGCVAMSAAAATWVQQARHEAEEVLRASPTTELVLTRSKSNTTVRYPDEKDCPIPISRVSTMAEYNLDGPLLVLARLLLNEGSLEFLRSVQDGRALE